MAPGDKAIEAMIATFHERDIQYRIANGEEPVEAMVAVWGPEGLRTRIKMSRLDTLQKLVCMASLETYEARQVHVSPQGASPYRDGYKEPPAIERRPKGFWSWLRGRFGSQKSKDEASHRPDADNHRS